jgi:DUF4097 and DUF4098 domain-containing protein YvlB
MFAGTCFADRTVEKKVSVSGNPFINIRTIAGNIRIIGNKESGAVKVIAEIHGDDVKPEIKSSGNKVEINEGRENPGFFGSSSGYINFEVHVPQQTTISGKSISGDIDIARLNGNVDMKTVSGDIFVETLETGDIELKSVSGEIRCKVKGAFSSFLTLSNVSGDIEVIFTSGASARLSTSTLSGRIRCELPLEDRQERKGFGSTTLSGILDDGKGRIKASSISGNIDILK